MVDRETSDLAALPPQDPRGKRLRRWIPGVMLLGGLIVMGLLIRFVWEESPTLEPKKLAPTAASSPNGVPAVFGELSAAAQRREDPPPRPGPSDTEQALAKQLADLRQQLALMEQRLQESQANPTAVKVKVTPQSKTTPKVDAEARRLAQERDKAAKAEAKRIREENAAARRGRLIWERKSEHTSEVGAVKTVSSPYSLMPGWMIPCALKYAMSSRAPGAIVATVTQNVYDSATGAHLLIPQGATLYGQSAGGTTFGDDTLTGNINQMVVGQQIYTMGGAKLQDQTGQTGLKDHVETFWARAMLSIGLKSVLQAGAGATPSMVGGAAQRIAGSVAQQSAAEGTRQVQQLINISPRLTVRQAYQCLMTVQEPISFSQPYTPIDQARASYRAQNGW